MTSQSSTKEALTIVDKLKQCILKQDQVIRAKISENVALKDKILALEKEREQLKRQILELKGVDLAAVDCTVVDMNHGQSSDDQSTPEGCNANFTPSSPVITVQKPEEDRPKSVSSPSKGGIKGSPSKGKSREASVKRNDSLNRSKSFNKKYELSPDLQERSLMLLERKYGGKEKAHRSAQIIQSYYRKYMMDRRFKRIRAYSETPDKLLRDKSDSNPTNVEKMSYQATPVLRLVKLVDDRNKKVRSTLIIDNITPCHAATPANLQPRLESVKTTDSASETKLLSSDEKSPVNSLNVEDERQSVSVNEHYVKVEMIEPVCSSPEVFTPDSTHFANGDVPRTRRQTTGDESDESTEDFRRNIADYSSVDSLDGVCMSSTALDKDLDTISVSSDFDNIRASSPKPQKLEMRIGINHFNRKPEKGIDYLIEHQVLDENPETVARFLISEHGISKQRLGEYLGNLQNEFNMSVLKCFTESLDFTGMEIDVALRLYLSHFRLPGEAQKIERLMEVFSEQYINCNPTEDESAQDKILILAFAIVMLNTDLHSPNVKKRMTEADFIRNLEGVNNGQNFPEESLKSIYSRILKREFTPARDHVTMTIKLEKKIIGKMPWTTLAAIHRYLRMSTSIFEVPDAHKKDKKHERVIFLFNDLLVVTKERGKPGQREGFHFYSYKYSFPLGGVKISLFNNDYYQYGIQLYSRIEGKVLATFNASDERSRKVVVDEMMECIDETNAMESDRIATEKQKQAAKRMERNLGNMTLPHPKKSRGKTKPSCDAISLLDVSVNANSLSTGDLASTKQLSSSLLNISDGDISFSSEPEGFKRCNSSSSLDSAFVDGDSNQGSSPRTSNVVLSSPKTGLFKKLRARNTAKSLNRGSPGASPNSSPQERARKISNPS
ncbi:IQ motif and SEC7 domain-containing protein 1-like isoform X1 [Actinia tenebrosa]|uniref:IQ motif and SEC7 domain-containing protein 1-like isoform X1 n=1 Tax=Actinia tenebrosa TaxID=6105 RepID=A0A6P8I791_ACTTE|nr:IQ motif and SEC7 domain-containing protein 1-like isoform X1 [Actinia tenebrosa]